MENVVGEFIKARQTARASESLESKVGKEAWGVYGYGLDIYNRTFGVVLKNGIESEIEAKKGQKIYCLDAFGEGQYIRDLIDKKNGVSGGMALTLVDLRNKEQRKIDKSNGLVMVNGDFFSGVTWNKIEDGKKDLGIDGFDLIACRPLAGLWIKGENVLDKKHELPLELKYVVVNKLWSLLTKNNGVLLVSMSMADEGERKKFKDWMFSLKEKSVGMFFYDAGQGGMTIKLARNVDSPETLPKIC